MKKKDNDMNDIFLSRVRAFISPTTSHINSTDKFNRKDILYSKYNIDMIYYLNRFPFTCYLGLLSSSLRSNELD